MHRRIITIESSNIYRFSFDDFNDLEHYVEQLMSENLTDVQYATLNWNKFQSNDFRKILRRIFIGIQQKIVSLQRHSTIYQQSKYRPVQIPYDEFSNIDLNKSKLITKQIHSLITNTKELMNNSQLSSTKYEMSTEHFKTFLSRVESTLQYINQEQAQFKFSKVYELPSRQRINKQLDQYINKLKDNSQMLQMIYDEMRNKPNDPKLKDKFKMFKNQVFKANEQINNFDARTQMQNQLKKEQPNLMKLFGDNIRGQNLSNRNIKNLNQLADMIEAKTKKTIAKGDQLYQSNNDDLNFHEYIDGYENLLVFVCTKNNIFGVFSTSKFNPELDEQNPDEQSTIAFIFAFSAQGLITFDFKPKYERRGEARRSLVYDKEALVIRNSDIRIDLQGQVIYSNIGSKQSWFESETRNYSVVLNSGHSRYSQFQSFDCYQVEFQSAGKSQDNEVQRARINASRILFRIPLQKNTNSSTRQHYY